GMKFLVTFDEYFFSNAFIPGHELHFFKVVVDQFLEIYLSYKQSLSRISRVFKDLFQGIVQLVNTGLHHVVILMNQCAVIFMYGEVKQSEYAHEWGTQVVRDAVDEAVELLIYFDERFILFL